MVKRKIRKSNNPPLVSVVIPTLNSEKTIIDTLISLKKQNYSNLEIIIADGKSHDGTLRIAKEFNARICFGRELGKARYEGLMIARGKYLLALDSDQFIDSTLIKRAVNEMEKNDYDALILNEKSIVRKGTFIERLLSYDKWAVVATQDTNPLFGAEIPRFFRRRLLLKLKWPKNVSILDDAILYKDNLKQLSNISHLGGSGISHYEVDSFFVFFKKFMRYGRLYSSTVKVSTETTLMHSFPRRIYFSRKVLKKPKIFIYLMILYLLKATAVVWGIIYYKIK